MDWVDWEAKGLTEDDLRKLRHRSVYSSDNQRIGTIDSVWSPMMQVNATTFRVKTDAHELWVPLFVIQRIEKDRVVLETTEDEIQQDAWRMAPPGWVPASDDIHLFHSG